MQIGYYRHMQPRHMVKRFQNKISGSRFLLATVAVITVLVWLASGRLGAGTAVNLAVTALTSYFLVELDTRNSIIRIYTRMIPASFLLLSTMTGAFTNDKFIFIGLLWTLFLLFFFSSYQDKGASGSVFYAFVCLGIASVLFVQTLFFVPVMWLAMQSYLMSMGRRTLAASVVGLLMPYWFILGFLLFRGDLSFLASHFAGIAEFGMPFDFAAVTGSCWISFALLVLLSLVGTVHYVRNSNKDKIRTRMFCETIVTTNLTVILFILLQPVYFTLLLPVLVITSSVLISHYIVLTNTKLTNRSVYVIILMVAAATVYNLWIS